MRERLELHNIAGRNNSEMTVSLCVHAITRYQGIKAHGIFAGHAITT